MENTNTGKNLSSERETGGGDLGQWERKQFFLDTQSTMTVVVGRGGQAVAVRIQVNLKITHFLCMCAPSLYHLNALFISKATFSKSKVKLQKTKLDGRLGGGWVTEGYRMIYLDCNIPRYQ